MVGVRETEQRYSTIDDGKWLAVWHRDADGTWRVLKDMSNSNHPAAAQAEGNTPAVGCGVASKDALAFGGSRDHVPPLKRCR